MRTLATTAIVVLLSGLAPGTAPIVGKFAMSGVDHWTRDTTVGESAVNEEFEFLSDRRFHAGWKSGKWSKRGSKYRANLMNDFREHVTAWYPTLEVDVISAHVKKIRLAGDAIAATSKFAYAISVDGRRALYSDESVLSGVRE